MQLRDSAWQLEAFTVQLGKLSRLQLSQLMGMDLAACRADFAACSFAGE